MTLSSRIGVMNAGEIVQTGTPSEVYEYPGSRFVAEFIGSVNLFEGRIVEDEPDHVLIESEEAGCPLYIDHGVSAAPGARVWVAVRPEKLALSREAPAHEHNRIEAVVDEIAYLGGLSIYHLRAGTGKKLRLTLPNQDRTAAGRLTWEERVYASWHPSSAVVLAS